VIWLVAPAFAMVASAADPALCVQGHPRKRTAIVTYAGLLPRRGYERDHFYPLCLGGPDVASNVWYQPYPQASVKDKDEGRMCMAYCRNQTTIPQAYAFLRKRWGKSRTSQIRGK
jgi:hypothetical protein